MSNVNFNLEVLQSADGACLNIHEVLALSHLKPDLVKGFLLEIVHFVGVVKMATN